MMNFSTGIVVDFSFLVIGKYCVDFADNLKFRFRLFLLIDIRSIRMITKSQLSIGFFNLNKCEMINKTKQKKTAQSIL